MNDKNTKLMSLLMGVGLTAIASDAAEANVFDEDPTYTSGKSSISPTHVYDRADIYTLESMVDGGCGNSCCGNSGCSCK